jgi:hypothetical protein
MPYSQANPFRILITGSRTWDDYDTLKYAIVDLLKEVVEDNPELRKQPLYWVTILHGNCPRGADRLAHIFASQVLKCKIEIYEADWRVGKKAGYIRNKRMVDTMPDACLAFIRDKSKGATGCRNLAKAAGIPTETIIYDSGKVKDGSVEA